MLGNGDEREISWTNGGCKINATSSWYLDCYGEKVPLSNALTGSTFIMEREFPFYNFEVNYKKLLTVVACLLCLGENVCKNI